MHSGTPPSATAPPPHMPRHSAPFPSPHLFIFLMLDVVFCCNCGQYKHVCCLPVPMTTKRQPQPSPDTHCVTHVPLDSQNMHAADFHRPSVPGGCDFCVGQCLAPGPASTLFPFPACGDAKNASGMLGWGCRRVAQSLPSMWKKGPGAVPCTAKQRTCSR